MKLRFTKPVEFRAETVTGSSEPKWIYRDKTGAIVSADTPDAIRYRRFWGFVSTEAVDFYNTIVERNAVIEAWPTYVKQGGNVRVMHESEPAGKIFEDDYEYRQEGVYAGVSIPEHKADVLRDIDSGLINAFSLGFNPYDYSRTSIEWSTSDSSPTRFKRIKIAEVSLVDAGATPGTDIKEERSITSDQEDTLFRRLWNRIAGMLNRQPAGTLPAEPQEDEMTPEQFEKLMAKIDSKIEERFTAIKGELGTIVERAAQVTSPSGAPSGTPQPPPAQPTGGTEKPIEQRIAEAVTSANAPLIAKITTLETELTTMKRSISTDEPLSADQIDAQLTAAEAALEEARKAGPTPNQKVSFIRHTAAGRPLTMGDLGGEE